MRQWTGISQTIKSVRVQLLVLALLPCVALSSPVHLAFYQQASVDSKDIFLGDIARITCAKEIALLKQKLVKVKVGQSAPAGFSRFLNTHDVIKSIRMTQDNSLNISSNNIDRIKIVTGSHKGTVEDFRATIGNYLESHIKWDKGDYSIHIENANKSWHCYKSKYTVEVEGLDDDYPRGTVRLILKIVQEEGERIIPVICKISVTTPVLCVSSKVSRNNQIRSNHIQLVNRDITHFRFIPLVEESDVLGKVARMTLTPGTILHTHCIRSKPDVAKGDIIEIALQKGRIKISMPARAREDGYIGEDVWVENLQSHKIIKATVLRKGIVYLSRGEAP